MAHNMNMIGVIEKWTNSDGDIFYEYTVQSKYKNTKVRSPIWYYLAKIDKTINIFEYVDSTLDFVSEIDPILGNYAIHYRQ